MRLYFLRHGLADRSAWDGSDFERPLTEFGKEKMAKSAKMIRSLDLKLDQIITSPLVRAFQTAEIVAAELDFLTELSVDERVGPGFNPRVIAEILEENPDWETLMFVGHEPDFSYTLQDLVGGGSIVCKKGSLARVDMTDAGFLSGELIWLIPPKALAL